jgi:NADPH:quinone reductase-like Zn-dependent oxidoreductase
MNLPTTMKALIQKHEGYSRVPDGSTLESLEPYVEEATLDLPPVTGRQVLVKVGLASINPSDVMFIKGLYGQPRVKGRPAGFEGVGEVVAAGEDAYARSLIGRRVAFATGTTNWGTWAEYAIAEAPGCIPIEQGVRDEDAAALIVNPLTALAMFDIVKEEGEKAFVLTAAASQLCKLIMNVAREEGFRPIAIVRRDDQIPILEEAGAAHVLNEKAADFPARLKEVVKAEQPRILLDAVTGPLAAKIFATMGRGARWIIYGRLDDTQTPIPEPGQLIFMQKRIEGFWLTDWMRRAGAERRAGVITEAQKRFRDGRWSTDVTAIVPLADAIARVPGELAKPNGKVFIAP